MLYHADGLYGEIEIDELHSDGMDEEDDADYGDREVVVNVLTAAKRIISVRVLLQGRDIETTLIRIDPLWNLLFAKRNGLMQADGEGFYDQEQLILALK